LQKLKVEVYALTINPEPPYLALAFDLTKSWVRKKKKLPNGQLSEEMVPESVEVLRHAYRCWCKRENGEPLDPDACEDNAADAFEEWWRRELVKGGPAVHRYMLKKVLNPAYSEQPSHREIALQTWSELYDPSLTWEQLKSEIEKRGGRTSKRHWNRLRQSSPFRGHF
jgi:hypothetical protein